jgi:hypothetical protein
MAMRLGPVACAVLALALVNCGADYVEENDASVLLVLTSINEGKPLASDVRSEGGSIVNCTTTAGLEVLVKNPNNPGSPVESVVLDRYDVSFTRSDGRAVEGVDVPYRFTMPLTATIVPGESGSVTIDVVRQQAKLEPPLSNITGLQIVDMTANVTVYGETVSRKAVSASGAAAIRFADYANGTPTCESGS